jgi:hypothetical protein
MEVCMSTGYWWSGGAIICVLQTLHLLGQWGPNYCEMVISGPLSELYLVSPCNLHARLSPSADINFTFWWDDDRVHFVLNQQLSWIFILITHWNNSLQVDMLLHLETLSWFPLVLHALPEKQQILQPGTGNMREKWRNDRETSNSFIADHFTIVWAPLAQQFQRR